MGGGGGGGGEGGYDVACCYIMKLFCKVLTGIVLYHILPNSTAAGGRIHL